MASMKYDFAKGEDSDTEKPWKKAHVDKKAKGDGPKRPVSAYILWSNDNRQRLASNIILFIWIRVIFRRMRASLVESL